MVITIFSSSQEIDHIFILKNTRTNTFSWVILGTVIQMSKVKVGWKIKAALGNPISRRSLIDNHAIWLSSLARSQTIKKMMIWSARFVRISSGNLLNVPHVSCMSAWNAFKIGFARETQLVLSQVSDQNWKYRRHSWVGRDWKKRNHSSKREKSRHR